MHATGIAINVLTRSLDAINCAEIASTAAGVSAGGCVSSGTAALIASLHYIASATIIVEDQFRQPANIPFGWRPAPGDLFHLQRLQPLIRHALQMHERALG